VATLVIVGGPAITPHCTPMALVADDARMTTELPMFCLVLEQSLRLVLSRVLRGPKAIVEVEVSR
jgi:hypothetical protein